MRGRENERLQAGAGFWLGLARTGPHGEKKQRGRDEAKGELSWAAVHTGPERKMSEERKSWTGQD